MMRSHPPTERAWVRHVAQHLAFETPYEASELVGPVRGGTAYLRELRLAAVWAARTSCGLGPSALARGFGRTRSAIVDQLNRADFLREWDPEFRKLTDTVAHCLGDRIWVRSA